MRIIPSILIMAAVTYLIRMLPLVLMRRQIRSRFFRSFLYYIPYAVLAAMAVPAIFFATGNLATAIAGTIVALILSFFEMPLIVVAAGAAVAALIASCLPLPF